MKTSRGAGGVVEDCTYENLTMKNVKTAILITDYYPRIPPMVEDDPAQPVGPGTPIFRHIHITNLTADHISVAGQIIGVAEMPIEDVVFDHVNIASNTGLKIVHAKGVEFKDSTIKAETGPNTILSDADVKGLPQ